MTGASSSIREEGFCACPNATRRHGSCAASTRTAQCLSSGCREDGSSAPIVSSFTPRRPSPPRNRAPQCMARKTTPCSISGIGVGLHVQVSAAGSDLEQLGLLQPKPRQIVGMDHQPRLRLVREEARDGSRAAHGVPLVAQAPGGEAQRIALVRLFGHGFVWSRHEACAARRRGEYPVLVEPLQARIRFFREKAIAAGRANPAAHRTGR